jgi:hypothetical protein
MELLFHDQMFFAPALPLEEVFDPTELEILCRRICRIYYTKQNISFENMKMRLFMVLI